MMTFPSQTQAEDQRCQDTVLELGGYSHQAKTTISYILINHMPHHVSLAGVATAYEYDFIPSQCRRNSYDGEMEYWVTLRETAKRTEESSYEEQHRKRMKACSIFGMFLEC